MPLEGKDRFSWVVSDKIVSESILGLGIRNLFCTLHKNGNGSNGKPF